MMRMLLYRRSAISFLDIEIDDYLTDEDYEELEEYEQQLNKKGM